MAARGKEEASMGPARGQQEAAMKATACLHVGTKGASMMEQRGLGLAPSQPQDSIGGSQ